MKTTPSTSDTLLKRSLSELRGVGPKVAENLSRLGLVTFEDALFHLPFRYEDRTRISSIEEVVAGDRVLIEGRVVKAHVVGRQRRSLVCQVSDGTGILTLRFFHFTRAQKETLQSEGVAIRCFGEIKEGFNAGWEMMHPEYRTGQSIDLLGLSESLTPIYPTQKGLSQQLLRKVISQVVRWLARAEVVELLPSTVLDHYGWESLSASLSYLHLPPPDANQFLLQSGMHPMQQRLVFEELLAYQLSLKAVRQKVSAYRARILVGDRLPQQLLSQLPFELTRAQQNVWSELEHDLRQQSPMLRLVQGDVGSGKTVVAALSICAAVEVETQAVMMAPTELLAEQHFRNLTRWLSPLGVRVELLVGAARAAHRRDVLNRLSAGEIDCLVGTHAVFQEGVEYRNLSLIVVDEQHRFGVHQRLSLMKKGGADQMRPHQLVMTATPIPRSLAMTAYGDLDCSVIDELPPGRKPIVTRVISQRKRQSLIEKLSHHASIGKQAYWVCTLVDESEVLQAQAAEVAANELQQALPQVNIGLVHGRMKSAEKEQVMQQFLQREIDVLVATTVIEVGVDVPNASLMIIENPERLGLAQLHQLRGRVGRGEDASFCLLLFGSALTKGAKARLEIMRETQDGFLIAEKDLEMRGPGEVLGVRQSGEMQFRMSDLIRDKKVLESVLDWQKQGLKLTVDQESHLIHRWLKSKTQFVNV